MNINELFQRSNLKDIEYYASKADVSFMDDKEYYLSLRVEDSLKVIEDYLDEMDFDDNDRNKLLEYIYKMAEVYAETHFEAGLFTGAKLGYQFRDFEDKKKGKRESI